MDPLFQALGIEKHLVPLGPLFHPVDLQATQESIEAGPLKSVEVRCDPYRSPRYVADEDDSDGASDSGDISFNQYRRRIRIGLAYQTEIPPQISADETINGDKPSATVCKAKLKWDPEKIEPEKVDEYIHTLKSLVYGESDFNQDRALEILHNCEYDTNKALTVALEKPLSSKRRLLVASWSEAERERFDTALRRSGKDFIAIQSYVKSKDIQDVIQFYYLRPFAKRPAFVSDFIAASASAGRVGDSSQNANASAGNVKESSRAMRSSAVESSVPVSFLDGRRKDRGGGFRGKLLSSMNNRDEYEDRFDLA